MPNKIIGEKDYFLAWLLFYLCSLAVGFVLGAIAGFFVGIIFGITGVREPSFFTLVIGITGFLIGLPVSYICFRIFVGIFIVKKFSHQAQQQPFVN